MTISARLAALDPAAPAVESGSRRWTVGALLSAAGRAADRVPPGDGPWAVAVTDPLDQLTWALAADLAGRTAAVLDPRWPTAQRAAALAAIRPAVVVDDEGPRPAGAGGVAGPGWVAFTSGTSGAPEPVWRTPESWADSYPAFTALTGLRPGDRVLVPGALSSSLCAFAALHALAAGAVAVLLTRWDTTRVPIADVLHLVPAMLGDLMAATAGHTVAVPRVVVVGGATLDPELERRVHRAWPSTRLVEYYGSSEQSFVTARAGGDAGTVGPAFPGVRIAVRDDGNRDQPAGTAGTIWTRSPYAATVPGSATGRVRTADGWLTVGDRGVLDVRGVLTLLGRDRIVTGGTTVEPAAVEAVLRTLPGVRDVVVVGQPHRRLGEVVAAVLAGEVRLPAARAHVRDRLAPAQRPRRWYTVEALPRTALGKPARGELSDAVRAGHLPRLS